MLVTLDVQAWWAIVATGDCSESASWGTRWSRKRLTRTCTPASRVAEKKASAGHRRGGVEELVGQRAGSRDRAMWSASSRMDPEPCPGLTCPWTGMGSRDDPGRRRRRRRPGAGRQPCPTRRHGAAGHPVACEQRLEGLVDLGDGFAGGGQDQGRAVAWGAPRARNCARRARRGEQEGVGLAGPGACLGPGRRARRGSRVAAWMGVGVVMPRSADRGQAGGHAERHKGIGGQRVHSSVGRSVLPGARARGAFGTIDRGQGADGCIRSSVQALLHAAADVGVLRRQRSEAELSGLLTTIYATGAPVSDHNPVRTTTRSDHMGGTRQGVTESMGGGRVQDLVRVGHNSRGDTGMGVVRSGSCWGCW